jgi:cytochrome c553
MAVHPDAPNLAHQPALAVTYQLIQFRDGRRSGGGMETMAQNLSDQDARDLSAYVATLPAPAGVAVPDQIQRQGQSIANALYCNSCHGEQLEGQKHVPRLAGQKQSYLERQLNHFKSGERIDLDGSMENAVLGLDSDSIRAVSAFAASR